MPLLRRVATIESIGSSSRIERHRGAYKTSSNSVAAFAGAGVQIGIFFETALPFDTPRLMQERVSWYDDATQDPEIHP